MIVRLSSAVVRHLNPTPENPCWLGRRNDGVVPTVGLLNPMGGMTMKSIITLSAALALATLVSGTSAEAKGCIKGAAAGGAAGSVAGHGKMGAAAGCAVGHSKANKKDQQGGGGQGQPSQQRQQ